MFLIWLILHDLRFSFLFLTFPSLLPCCLCRIDHQCCSPLFEVPYKIKSTIFPWLRSSRSSDYCNGRSLGFITLSCTEGWESEFMVSGRNASFSSVERGEIPRLFTHSLLLPILKTGTILESFQSYGIFSVSQKCRASFYGIEASSTLPCYRSSADIPYLQAGALPFFVALIAFNSSLNACFLSL